MSQWSLVGVAASQGTFDLGPISLELGNGEAIAVVGRSGAGKTTLLRTVAGLAPLHTGRIFRDGKDASAWPPEQRGIAYVPQGLGLFPHRTVERNVRYPLELRGLPRSTVIVSQLLDRFGLRALARRYPGELSAGEQQRVAVARALASAPKLLLWDEPLITLDVLARDDLLQALAEVRERDKTPLLFVTHDASIAFSLADRFLHLDRGTVLFAGPSRGFFDAPSDRFAARFLGFENIYTREDLARRPQTRFGQWLLAHSGSEGVCFPTRPAHPDPGKVGESWTGSVRAVELDVGGVRAAVDVEGVSVKLSVNAGVGAIPHRSDRLSFSLERSDLRPLGASASGRTDGP